MGSIEPPFGYGTTCKYDTTFIVKVNYSGCYNLRVETHVISENDWLIALDKPAGLIVHSDGRTKEPALVDRLLARWPSLVDVGEPWLSPQGESIARPGIVHRLDRTTSGVMIVAKTREAWEYLRAEFKARNVDKKYLALVQGRLEGEGRISAEIDKGGNPKRWFAKDCPPDAKRAAITDWKARESRDAVTLVEAMPRTGRTHQLRVHFAHIGHPIVGDPIYGAGQPTHGFDRVMLHASSIALKLPDDTRATYTAPTPPGFK
jgi:23S rRNA pseudouridine1911/1915/1917 synthase